MAAGSVAVIAWPTMLRPDDSPATVEVLVDASRSGRVAVVRQDGRRVTETSDLGRALADGFYAALRPYGLSDGLR
jgi:hypothetical protein